MTSRSRGCLCSLEITAKYATLARARIPQNNSAENYLKATERHRISQGKSLSDNARWAGDEGFWLRPRRHDLRIPAAGCNGRANEGPAERPAASPAGIFRQALRQDSAKGLNASI